MGAYGASAGALMTIAGSFLGAKAAKTRQKRLESLANTPGLNIGDITRESLGASGANFGMAANLTNRINQSTAAGQRSLLESSLPGYQDRKQKELSIIDSYLRGEVPEDVQRQIWNSRAANLLGRFGGTNSGFGLNAQLTDLGKNSFLVQQAGLDRTGQINRETAALEMPQMANVASYLGLNPTQLTGLRSGERTQRLDLMGQAIGAPTGKDVWAKSLTDVGGAMMGGGLSTAGTPGFTSFSGLSGTPAATKRPTSGSYTDYLGYGG